MNIDDTKTEDVTIPPRTEIMTAIFLKQHELAMKYGPIERRNGFYYPPIPVPHIDDAQFQRWIKDMFWRVTEEIAEAFEVEPSPSDIYKWREQWKTNVNLRHFYEELADALHFLVEVTLVVGVLPTEIELHNESTPLPEMASNDIIMAMGLAANTLKNKPWKSTQMSTDIVAFKRRLLAVWDEMFTLWNTVHVPLEDMYLLYIKKHNVNLFRTRTNY